MIKDVWRTDDHVARPEGVGGHALRARRQPGNHTLDIRVGASALTAGVSATSATMPRVSAIPYDHELAIAIRAAREAGATALQMQGAVQAMTKADGSPVTPGDLAADAIVRQHLTLNFPADAILSEEEADAPAT
jgi:hypothetical protein